MIRDDAVTMAFHRLTIQNRNNAIVSVDDTIKNIIIQGLKSLKVVTPEDKKQCFKTHNLYVNRIEEDTDNVYCQISDSRYGYPEDIFMTNSSDPIATGINDIRSKQFFVCLDFSNTDYILVGNQYLGNSGCYMAIEKALSKILKDSGYKLNSTAITNKGELNAYFQKGGIKSFEVTHFKPQSDVADDNAFCKKCTVTLSPVTRGRSNMDKFYNKVRSLFLGDEDNIQDKRTIAEKIIKESDISVALAKNEGIDGVDLELFRVKVISNHGTFDLINQDGTVARRYDVPYCKKDADGNPNFEDIKTKTNELKKKIKESME